MNAIIYTPRIESRATDVGPFHPDYRKHKERRYQAAYCEVAERILTSNQSPDGLAGVFDISKEKFKRLAASVIIGMRRNRIACKNMGLNWRGAGARQLALAADYRRMAAGVEPLATPLRVFPNGFGGEAIEFTHIPQPAAAGGAA